MTAKAGSAKTIRISRGPCILDGATTLATVGLACLAAPVILKWLARDMSSELWKQSVPANSHHALPDGYADRLLDLADRIQMMPFALGKRQFEDYKNDIIRQLASLAEFPHPVS